VKGEFRPRGDTALKRSFDLMKAQLSPEFRWPDRDRIPRSFAYGATTWLVNVKIHVTRHLVTRAQHWLFLQLEAVVKQEQPRITAMHLQIIADHIISTLVWKEKQAVARALRRGRRPPPPPLYKPPETIDKLLGASVQKRLPQLSKRTKEAVWDVFRDKLLANISQDALPIYPSKFGVGVRDEK